MTDFDQLTVTVTVKDTAVILTRQGQATDGTLSRDRRTSETLRLLQKYLAADKLQDREEFELLGSCLFDYLFADNVRSTFRSYLHSMQPNQVLRIVLIFESDFVGTAALPWEYLYIPTDVSAIRSGFIATRSEYLLSRRIRLDDPFDEAHQPNATVEPLRILVGIASPDRECLPRWSDRPRTRSELDTAPKADLADVATLADNLVQELRAGGAEVVTEHDLTLSKLTAALQYNGFRPHVVHMVAHGDYQVDRGGSLALCHGSESRIASWTRDSDLADSFSHIPSVVFLHACSGGRTEQVRGFRGVALRMVSKGVPAVVGMNFGIDAGLAKDFALTFYQELGKGLSVDQAVQIGRNKITESGNSGAPYSLRSFGCPIAFVQVPGAVILPEVIESESDVIAQDGALIDEPVDKVEFLDCPVCFKPLHPAVMRCPNCTRKGRDTRVELCPNPTCRKFWSRDLGVCTWCDHQATPTDSRVVVAEDSEAVPAGGGDVSSVGSGVPTGAIGSKVAGGDS